MNRPIALVGAPSSIGIRPYDNGEARHLDRAPAVLRELRVVERLGAVDLGDVVPPPYRDFVRSPGHVRNEPEVAAYCEALGERIAAATADRRFAVVLGGDCSIVLGGLLGARQTAGGSVGLAYFDAHADFGSPEESRTGSAASMCLALAVGRGDSRLARLAPEEPLTRPERVVLIGRRDHGEPWYGHDALRASAILDIPHAAVRAQRPAEIARHALKQLVPAGTGSFWVHLDADVFDPSIVPAVDSPEPEGLQSTELVELLAPLLDHPGALGMELTIYDPGLDPQRASGQRLADFLEQLIRG